MINEDSCVTYWVFICLTFSLLVSTAIARSAAVPCLITVVQKIWRLSCRSWRRMLSFFQQSWKHTDVDYQGFSVCLKSWLFWWIWSQRYTDWTWMNQLTNPINQNSCNLIFLSYNNALMWRIIHFPFTLISLSGFKHNGKQDYFMGFRLYSAHNPEDEIPNLLPNRGEGF